MSKYILFPLIIFISACDNKREALGADNEIRVICSNIDKKVMKKYLSLIFNDTLYTPEAEPYYHLKFSEPDKFNQLKAQSMVIVGSIKQDDNSGLKLMNQLLPDSQFKSTLQGDPVILGKDVYAKKQLLMIINARSEDHLMSSFEQKRNQFRKHFNDQFIERQGRFLFGDDRNTLSSELSAGDFIWNWPKDNYKTIQINNYKFKLDKTNHGDTFAYRAQGIWETVSLKESKGGPFRSYLFYDSVNDLTYHLNFLIHHPGDDKSIFMRQMDMIIKTFRTSI
ncbi:MAG: DUF4837 family protein [Candidatus Neomarinimicrobiota bacterium]